MNNLPASSTYDKEMERAWRSVRELMDLGWSLPRIVTRARNLYRQAYRSELLRSLGRQ